MEVYNIRVIRVYVRHFLLILYNYMYDVYVLEDEAAILS